MGTMNMWTNFSGFSSISSRMFFPPGAKPLAFCWVQASEQLLKQICIHPLLSAGPSPTSLLRSLLHWWISSSWAWHPVVTTIIMFKIWVQRWRAAAPNLWISQYASLKKKKKRKVCKSSTLDEKKKGGGKRCQTVRPPARRASCPHLAGSCTCTRSSGICERRGEKLK